MKRLFSYVMICLLSVACSSGSLDTGKGSLPDAAVKDVAMLTKGSGDGRTYIFYLIGNRASATEGVRTWGTYVDAENGQPLCPADPETKIYDSSKGLRAQDGYYRMYVASPAVPAEETSAGSGIYGYEFDRNEPGVYVSEPIGVSVSGVYLTGSHGSEYVYDVSEQILRQPRSRIKLNFACGDDIASATLKSLSLNNFIDHGYYIPEEKSFDYTADDIEESYLLFPKSGEDDLVLTTGNRQALDIDEYILSMNYKDVDSYGDYKHPIPSLDIEVGSAYGSLSLHAALGWDFKPQHTYEFTITINSVYVNLQVTATAWEQNGDDVSSDVGDTGTWKIEFPLKEGSVLLLDWEKVNVTGTIS